MLFWRYSPDQKVKTLIPKAFSYFVSFFPNTQSQLEGIFLSADKFTDIYEAHDYSAITYYPKSGASFDIDFSKFTVLNNEKRLLDVNSNIGMIGRTWPAFGSTGGTIEIILVNDPKRTPVSSLKPVDRIDFRDGGEFDYYKSENTVSYGTIIAKAISEGIFNLEQELKPSPERTFAYFKPEVGTAVFFQLGPRFYSISSGTKFFGKTGKIHFWAYTYEDNENILERRYIGPIEETIEFTCIGPKVCDAVKKFSDNMKAHSYPYRDIAELSRQLMSQLSRVTEPYFNQNAKIFKLK